MVLILKEMIDEILQIVSHIPLSGFFVVSEIKRESSGIPQDIHSFLNDKLAMIKNGITGRQFKYEKDGWIIIFTFFPTDRVVDEKYALKNKVFKQINHS